MMRMLLLIPAFLVGACGNPSTMPSAAADAFDFEADQVTFGMQSVLTNAGVRTALLTSDTAYHYELSRRIDLFGVSLVFFDENGVEVGTLTSQTGDYNTSTGVFIARGGVVLITQGPNGTRRLETEELYYDLKGDETRSDRPFVLNDGGRISEGASFRSDAKFSTWEVTGGRTQGTVSGGDGLSF
jgi:LPS export ABC transporter protein LptC